MIKLVLLLFLYSCAITSIAPNFCKTNANWEQFTEAEDKKTIEKEYFVFDTDNAFKISEMLKEKNVSCDNLKKIKVEIENKYFFKRIIRLTYVEK